MSDEEDIDVPVIDRKTGKEVAMPGREVIDWKSGEIVDVSDASTLRLAQLIDDLAEAREGLSDVERVVNVELINRLDLDASWTWHDGGYTVSAPSNSAGTEEFPIDALEAALEKLVDKKIVSIKGASKAIKRQVTLTIDVPLGTPIPPLVEMFKGETVSVEDKQMPIVKVDSRVAKVAAGITALRKIPAAAKILKTASKTVDPPPRKVKVERK